MLQTATVAPGTLDPLMADRAVIYSGDVDETLIAEIEMIGYEFNFDHIKKRIVQMTDNPEKVYSTAPLKLKKTKR